MPYIAAYRPTYSLNDPQNTDYRYDTNFVWDGYPEGRWVHVTPIHRERADDNLCGSPACCPREVWINDDGTCPTPDCQICVTRSPVTLLDDDDSEPQGPEVDITQSFGTISSREEDNAANDTLSCGCESCKMARFEGTTLKRAVVHSYSYAPARWKMHKGAADRYKRNLYYLGVELETTKQNYRSASKNIAADMRLPKRFWVAKNDSSVTGPEFASHPATLAFWHSKQAELDEMFKMLRHGGYRSHDGGKAGMHVNISRDAFADARHLYRFLTLLHVDTNWSLVMSQRTSSQASQWANLGEHNDVVARRRHATGSFNRSYYCNRYSALNAPAGESRFEFRLPRGTLRLDRFYKNLEFTVGMIEYTRDNKVRDCSPAPFMKWVETKATEYPNLNSFINEKFAAK
jgi:hypothetical protein